MQTLEPFHFHRVWLGIPWLLFERERASLAAQTAPFPPMGRNPDFLGLFRSNVGPEYLQEQPIENLNLEESKKAYQVRAERYSKLVKGFHDHVTECRASADKLHKEMVLTWKRMEVWYEDNDKLEKHRVKFVSDSELCSLALAKVIDHISSSNDQTAIQEFEKLLAYSRELALGEPPESKTLNDMIKLEQNRIAVLGELALLHLDSSEDEFLWLQSREQKIEVQELKELVSSCYQKVASEQQLLSKNVSHTTDTEEGLYKKMTREFEEGRREAGKQKEARSRANNIDVQKEKLGSLKKMSQYLSLKYQYFQMNKNNFNSYNYNYQHKNGISCFSKSAATLKKFKEIIMSERTRFKHEENVFTDYKNDFIKYRQNKEIELTNQTFIKKHTLEEIQQRIDTYNTEFSRINQRRSELSKLENTYNEILPIVIGSMQLTTANQLLRDDSMFHDQDKETIQNLEETIQNLEELLAFRKGTKLNLSHDKHKNIKIENIAVKMEPSADIIDFFKSLVSSGDIASSSSQIDKNPHEDQLSAILAGNLSNNPQEDTAFLSKMMDDLRDQYKEIKKDEERLNHVYNKLSKKAFWLDTYSEEDLDWMVGEWHDQASKLRDQRDSLIEMEKLITLSRGTERSYESSDNVEAQEIELDLEARLKDYKNLICEKVPQGCLQNYLTGATGEDCLPAVKTINDFINVNGSNPKNIQAKKALKETIDILDAFAKEVEVDAASGNEFTSEALKRLGPFMQPMNQAVRKLNDFIAGANTMTWEAIHLEKQAQALPQGDGRQDTYEQIFPEEFTGEQLLSHNIDEVGNDNNSTMIDVLHTSPYNTRAVDSSKHDVISSEIELLNSLQLSSINHNRTINDISGSDITDADIDKIMQALRETGKKAKTGQQSTTYHFLTLVAQQSERIKNDLRNVRNYFEGNEMLQVSEVQAKESVRKIVEDVRRNPYSFNHPNEVCELKEIVQKHFSQHMDLS